MRKPQRKRKGSIKSPQTKKHLTPGLENQVGANLSAAQDREAEAGSARVRWLGGAAVERAEFERVTSLPLADQVRIAVVGKEKFPGMGPGVVFDLRQNKELDGVQTMARLDQLEAEYARYRRWDEKTKRFRAIKLEVPIEYRTISFPKFRSRALQRALEEGVLAPAEFRQFLRLVSKIARREFRKATRYNGAEAGLEAEIALWHLQQSVMHLHLVIRKVDDDKNRLGLVGAGGRLVWNELDLTLIAERRRRALGFTPTPKVETDGTVILDWRLLDRWVRSRVEGDNPIGPTLRARDRGLDDTWDMKVNDALDLVMERWVDGRTRLLTIWLEEEEKARRDNNAEVERARRLLGAAGGVPPPGISQGGGPGSYTLPAGDLLKLTKACLLPVLGGHAPDSSSLCFLVREPSAPSGYRLKAEVRAAVTTSSVSNPNKGLASEILALDEALDVDWEAVVSGISKFCRGEPLTPREQSYFSSDGAVSARTKELIGIATRAGNYGAKEAADMLAAAQDLDRHGSVRGLSDDLTPSDGTPGMRPL